MVQSYAHNLGDWVSRDGKPEAGLRMEIPDRMRGDFKQLEQYGHAMREKHGEGLKRHIKMDDAGMFLYIDLYIPKMKQWTRVDMALVKKDNTKRAAKKAVKIDANLLMTADTDGEEEKEK